MMAHILVVDADKDLCALLRTALERAGPQVSTRLSGREVDESACRWADCILLDVMMPGEDGFALCRRIRALADCPIPMCIRDRDWRWPERAGRSRR